SLCSSSATQLVKQHGFSLLTRYRHMRIAHDGWSAIQAASSRGTEGCTGRARDRPQRPGGQMNTWKSGAALLVAAVAAITAGCTTSHGGTTVTAALSGEDPDITVAAIPSADLAGLDVALDEGLFARQGLPGPSKKHAST